MYLEYNWTANVYQPRFGDTFIDIDGWRSFATLDEARFVLASRKLKLGRKTDTCTWAIESVEG